MFAVFSLIENIPTIHKIYVSEETTQTSLCQFVIQYIEEGRKENKETLTLPLSDIKTDTFTTYPIRTYLPIDSSMIEIYEHSLKDKVDKGWVWNGMMKVVESKKIGYFQVLRVTDPHMESNREYNSLSFEMDALIDEIMSEISDARTSLEKDIEDVKKLQLDVHRHLEHPILIETYEMEENVLDETKNLTLPSIDISYERIEYPCQPGTGQGTGQDFVKRDLKLFEEKYLPIIEDEDNKEVSMDEIGTTDSEEDLYVVRCKRSRRGSWRSIGRSKEVRLPYGTRKMRLRSY